MPLPAALPAVSARRSQDGSRTRKFGVTIGGGAIDNPGRYPVLIPPVNGANAASGSPSFTANPGDRFAAWDASITCDYMPSQFLTFRLEGNYRAASVPYFSGAGGVTPPGGNIGPPGSIVLEPRGVINTGDARTKRTADRNKWI